MRFKASLRLKTKANMPYNDQLNEYGEEEAERLNEQEYQLWLYEIVVIHEINKELNYERNITSFS